MALSIVGISPIPWLTSPEWAMPSLILLSVWSVGPTVVIFLAGLQDVPRTLYEAAQIDGAGPLSLVRHVTIPMISPVILFNLVIGMIGALQVFALPFIIFGNSGGSAGRPAQRGADVLGAALRRSPSSSSRWAMPRRWPGSCSSSSSCSR